MRNLWAVASLLCFSSPCASGAYIVVYGGPTFDAATATGYVAPVLQAVPGHTAGNGAAVGWAARYNQDIGVGLRAFRWDATGAAAVELQHLNTDGLGRTTTTAHAINGTGTSVGSAVEYDGNTDLGSRAVRWDAFGAVTELDNLGTDGGGRTGSYASAINSTGAVVGDAHKWSGNVSLGYRAVRWDAGGTAVTELENLGTNSAGSANNHAVAINTAGVVAGSANKYNGGIALGDRAVRWNSSGTITELGHLGTRTDGVTFCHGFDINEDGTVAGYAEAYTGEGTSRGLRAVRWDAGGTAATELETLGTDSSGSTYCIAGIIDDTGAVAGFAEKYDGGVYRGGRAVRWEATGTAATELGTLETDASGFTRTEANSMNSAGVVVGYANTYVDNVLQGRRAVLWNLDAVALDLNTLIDPASGWTLNEARGISHTNWVTGIGTFDPDGSGPLAGYGRAFLLDASPAVPEPTAHWLLSVSIVWPLRRRRARGCCAGRRLRSVLASFDAERHKFPPTIPLN